MCIKVERRFLHRIEQLTESHLAGKSRPKHMHTQQIPDYILQFRMVAIRQGNAYENVIVPGIAVKQRVECSGEDGEDANFLGAADIAQRVGQIRVEFPADPVPLVRLDQDGRYSGNSRSAGAPCSVFSQKFRSSATFVPASFWCCHTA